MNTKRSYADSHWLIFALQGLISLLFGWYIQFTSAKDITMLVIVVGVALLGLGIIELFNLLNRSHLREAWGFSFIIAIVEIAVACTLLFTPNVQPVFHLAIIASYTVIRGIFKILLGLRSVDDKTDKFIWVVIGMVAVIMGFAILNSGDQGDDTFIKFFGAYMMLSGLAQLIYGAHNREQVRMVRADRSAAAKRAYAAASKPAVKAPAKKTVAKKPAARKTAAKKNAKKSDSRKR